MTDKLTFFLTGHLDHLNIVINSILSQFPISLMLLTAFGAMSKAISALVSHAQILEG